MSTDRLMTGLLALCIITLCFGEIYQTILQKPHSELFDATIGSLVGFIVGRAATLHEMRAKNTPKAKPSKKK